MTEEQVSLEPVIEPDEEWRQLALNKIREKHGDTVSPMAQASGQGGVGAANLPTVVVSRGAKSAIGFQGEIDCDLTNTWTNAFFEVLSYGDTVYEACQYLASNGYQSTAFASYVLCGDGGTVLFPVQ